MAPSRSPARSSACPRSRNRNALPISFGGNSVARRYSSVAPARSPFFWSNAARSWCKSGLLGSRSIACRISEMVAVLPTISATPSVVTNSGLGRTATSWATFFENGANTTTRRTAATSTARAARTAGHCRAKVVGLSLRGGCLRTGLSGRLGGSEDGPTLRSRGADIASSMISISRSTSRWKPTSGSTTACRLTRGRSASGRSAEAGICAPETSTGMI